MDIFPNNCFSHVSQQMSAKAIKVPFIFKCRVSSFFPFYTFSETDKFLIGSVSWFCSSGGMKKQISYIFLLFATTIFPHQEGCQIHDHHRCIQI